MDGSAQIYVAGNLDIEGGGAGTFMWRIPPMTPFRKITPAGVTVTTLAGAAGSAGSADGTGSAARFNSPGGVAVDDAGNVYVADTGNDTIRDDHADRYRWSHDLGGDHAGRFSGTSDFADGTGSAARFNSPGGSGGG